MAKLKDTIKHDIYLVWALRSDGQIALAEISTTQSRADMCRKMTLRDKNVIRATIEKRETNHFFGSSLSIRDTASTAAMKAMRNQ